MRGNARTSRIAAYVASGALVVSGAVLAVTPAEAVTHDPIGLNQGTTWLKSQLKNGVVHNDQFNFDDIGLTIDFALALTAVGGQGTTVQGIRTALASKVGSYVQADEFQSVAPFGFVQVGRYANATAKALVFAQTTGADPAAYGGHNLVTDLNARAITTGPSLGRIADDSSFGDFGNTLGQAYAARGLTTAGSGQAADVTAFLLKQQCPSGGFRLTFTADKTAAGQSCTDNTQAETDATAIALQQLNQVPTTGAISAAKTAAVAWLLAAQRTDGSWGGGTSTSVSNANSTGLAASALGDTPDSEQAAQWLRAHQATDYDFCDKLAGHRGAIAYDNAGLAAGRRNGITANTADQWRRASAQAVPALAYLPLDTTPSAPVLTGPRGFLKAGTRQVLATSGVTAGDQLCLTGVGAAVQGTATTTRWQSNVVLPAGTRTRVYTVRDSFGHADSAALKVLGRANLGVVKSNNRVKRSRFVTATVSGLAPREWARIVYKGKLVRSGFASSTGKFVATFRVGRAKGKKQIVGYGHFTDIRRGATTIRVVR